MAVLDRAECETVSYQSGTETEGNTPEEQFVMSRDCRVSEHLDIKSIVDLTSCSKSQVTAIFLEWRPFGSSDNRWVTNWILSIITLSLSDPVSPGEVGGALHPSSLSTRPEESSAKSSRQGKEQTRPKISESGRSWKVRWSDLREGENPRNKAREIHRVVTIFKHTTPRKADIVSASAALMRSVPRMKRARVW